MVFILFCSATRDIEKVTYPILMTENIPEVKISDILSNIKLVSPSDRDAGRSVSLSSNER